MIENDKRSHHRRHRSSSLSKTDGSRSFCLSEEREVVAEKPLFECKGCKKVFKSHQALGGHRASHKRVKGCFASKIDDEDEDEDCEGPPSEASSSAGKRGKTHECSVCRRVFASGQALGGHKRSHWLTTSAAVPNFNDFHPLNQQFRKKRIFTKPSHHYDLDLDLNLKIHDRKNC